MVLTELQSIVGIRHKCLDCPDWDYCTECNRSAIYIHPRHRFAPIYDPLPELRRCVVRHQGIFCDGPLCKDKPSSIIEGVRYKCAVCDDTDFCANCEAAPNSPHNRTHPLIKFNTPVRGVSITTTGENRNGISMPLMGDRPPRWSMAAETISTLRSTSESVQTETASEPRLSQETVPKPTKEKIEIKDLLAEPIEEKIKGLSLLVTPLQPQPKVEKKVTEEKAVEEPAKVAPTIELAAHFVRDLVPDGAKMRPDTRFPQVWKLINPGPHAWPVGCAVRFVGGDNMLDIEQDQPSSAKDIAQATESNVTHRVVNVGEEMSFRVVMRSPRREGKAISYWRLKTADGVAFGHRLWCDINVVALQSAQWMVPKAEELANPADRYSSGASILADYHEQLALLEQQNSRRLLTARMEARSLKPESTLPDQQKVRPPRMMPERVVADTQMSRMLQEQSRRRRLSLMAQHTANHPPMATQELGSSEKLALYAMERNNRLSMPGSGNPGPGVSPMFVDRLDNLGQRPTIRTARKEDADRAQEFAQEREKIKQLMKVRREASRTEVQASTAHAKALTQALLVVSSNDEESGPPPATQKAATPEADTKKEEEVAVKSESSSMIFPKLDKESPVESKHEAESTTSAPAQPAQVEDEDEDEEIDLFEDATSITDDDDAFLTDEEYEILGASDEDRSSI